MWAMVGMGKMGADEPRSLWVAGRDERCKQMIKFAFSGLLM
jgi:hypothetical protein